MDRDEIAHRLKGARSATIGTVDERGRPHLVPIVFAPEEGRVYTAVDLKPKSTLRPKRLRNIDANPNVSVLVDHYDDHWSRLWWVRLDGPARVVRSGASLRMCGGVLMWSCWPPGGWWRGAGRGRPVSARRSP